MMTFDEVQAILKTPGGARADRKFCRQGWKPGQYVYSGDPPDTVFMVDPVKGQAEFKPTKSDLEATDWIQYVDIPVTTSTGEDITTVEVPAEEKLSVEEEPKKKRG